VVPPGLVATVPNRVDGSCLLACRRMHAPPPRVMWPECLHVRVRIMLAVTVSVQMVVIAGLPISRAVAFAAGDDCAALAETFDGWDGAACIASAGCASSASDSTAQDVVPGARFFVDLWRHPQK